MMQSERGRRRRLGRQARVEEAHEDRAVLAQAEEPEPADVLLTAMLLDRLADRAVVVALARRRRVQEGLERVVAAGGSSTFSPARSARRRGTRGTHFVTQIGEFAILSKARPSMSIATARVRL